MILTNEAPADRAYTLCTQPLFNARRVEYVVTVTWQYFHRVPSTEVIQANRTRCTALNLWVKLSNYTFPL